MGVLLKASNGEEFADSYNSAGLISMIGHTNNSLLSWDDLFIEAQLKGLPAVMETLEHELIQLSLNRMWYLSSGSPLSVEEKTTYLRRLIELLTFLRIAHRNEHTITWSV